MIRHILKHTAAIALLVCSAQALPAAEGILVKNGDKIAFLGDSITAAGWQNEGGYVKLVVDGLEKAGVTVTPIPAGVSGHKSNDMLERLERDVLAKEADWMTLSCGVNDVWHGERGVKLEDYKKNITAIVDQATAQGTSVLIMTATPIGENSNPNNDKLAPYNKFLRDLAQERGFPLADLSASLHAILDPLQPDGNSRVFTIDGVHMNPNGNVLMAQGILEAFGVTPAQIKRIEQEWLGQADTAIMGSHRYDPRPRLTMTLGQYRALTAIAKQNKSSVLDTFLSMWFRAVAEVVASHSADAVLAPDVIKQESHQLLSEKIEKLVIEE